MLFLLQRCIAPPGSAESPERHLAVCSHCVTGVPPIRPILTALSSVSRRKSMKYAGYLPAQPWPVPSPGYCPHPIPPPWFPPHGLRPSEAPPFKRKSSGGGTHPGFAAASRGGHSTALVSFTVAALKCRAACRVCRPHRLGKQTEEESRMDKRLVKLAVSFGDRQVDCSRLREAVESLTQCSLSSDPPSQTKHVRWACPVL